MPALSALADETDDDPVRRSWRRCIDQHRLDPATRPNPRRCEAGELERRRARLADVIDGARHEMSTLFQQLADPESAVVLADTDGVILHLVSSPAFSAELARVGFEAGAAWDEPQAGTNGVGTCLALGQPVSIRQQEHFFAALTSLTCSAVPVHEPSGRLAAVLDVTSRSSLMQQHLLVLLGMTARMIENRLIDRRFGQAHPLHFHSRPEFVHTLHEGRLALDAQGRILAANRSALFQLGLKQAEELHLRPVEDIFQTTLEELLERSGDAGFHPVVLYRARGGHRFFAVARRPPGATAAAGSPRPGRRVSVPATTATADVGSDPRLCDRLATARRVIARGTPLLLRAETGAGKEVFARAVHAGSPRAAGAFVAVNCASLPESLIEAELFGYRAGAFTGAQKTGRRGRILQADGGTLFLDEIGDMPLELQARLLRVLDERQISPLGGDETLPVDFQLLSASHRDLLDLVEQGRFREDLYYRLAGLELELPALRERADRLELIERILHEEGGAAARLDAQALKHLDTHPWPGNVRQLRHVLRAACALADGRSIGLQHLPALQRRPRQAPPEPQELPAVPASTSAQDQLQQSERETLLRLIEHHRWNMSSLARDLGMSRNTLYRRLHRLRIPLTAG
ncbi:sigma-54-dependent Fis family transcriptional regulator (plasmid) [Sphaerotilus natans]|uniref:sigma-54-dependent Fis family transcriptional regulator n=1 Tax=Sphaerotilus natans TaxID=34103 RepID=UPI00406CD81F